MIKYWILPSILPTIIMFIWGITYNILRKKSVVIKHIPGIIIVSIYLLIDKTIGIFNYKIPAEEIIQVSTTISVLIVIGILVYFGIVFIAGNKIVSLIRSKEENSPDEVYKKDLNLKEIQGGKKI